MSNLYTSKTNFTAGELAHDLLGRVDLRSYENGAMALKNVFIQPTGGVYRRPGLKYVQKLAGSSRLLTFDVGPTEKYLIVLGNKTADIYRDNVLQTTLATPWDATQIFEVRWCQNEEMLIIVHPDEKPRLILKNATGFVLKEITFSVDNGAILAPYHKFVDDNVTMASSALTGSVTLTVSADYFTADQVGMQLRIGDGYAEIKTVTDARTATAEIKRKLVLDGADTASLEPTRSWAEPALTPERGWPVSVTFYQSRLVFGGSKSLPNNLWFSVSGESFNFDLGSAYDADGIDFSLLSDGSNQICALFAGRHLQVFTTHAEWMVTGDPLTPTNIRVKRQTQVGSKSTPYVPVIGIDGASIFAAANGHEVLEFLYADLDEIYQATNLSLLSAHLINNPTDMAYDKDKRLAYIIMSDGKMCALTSFRAEDIQSFSEQLTDGAFKSVCVTGKTAYFVVLRNGVYFLECLDEACQTDAAQCQTVETPTDTVAYLPELNGKTVRVLADDVVLTPKTVQNGAVSLENAASVIEVGLPYTHHIVPLPPYAGVTNGNAPVSHVRFVKGIFRVADTRSFQIDTGCGVHQELNLPLTGCVQNADDSVTGDIVVRALGWTRQPTSPLWEITGDLPRAFKLLCVTQDLKTGG